MSVLARKSVEKPWGRFGIPPQFEVDPRAQIGEIWFEPPAEADALLIKYIFTTEKLSVQVHPSDAEAAARGEPSGKEECWYVLAADDDAILGIGTLVAMSAEQLRAAALDGSIEQKMDWKPVQAGDFYYIPAGTVHAIGPGITLIEVQQNADITYRLFDYGRPRELHLDDGVAVSKAAPYPEELHQVVPEKGEVLLVDGPYFRLWRCDGPPVDLGDAAGPFFVVPIDKALQVSGEKVSAGNCAVVHSLDEVDFSADGKTLLAIPN